MLYPLCFVEPIHPIMDHKVIQLDRDRLQAYRILIRGGIYLYPGDARDGYREGRLRLLYEAFPIAFLIEQAGSGATNGWRRIPLVFGSSSEVERVTALHRAPGNEWSPLFGQRGLFRQAGTHNQVRMDGLACL